MLLEQKDDNMSLSEIDILLRKISSLMEITEPVYAPVKSLFAFTTRLKSDPNADDVKTWFNMLQAHFKEDDLPIDDLIAPMADVIKSLPQEDQNDVISFLNSKYDSYSDMKFHPPKEGSENWKWFYRWMVANGFHAQTEMPYKFKEPFGLEDFLRHMRGDTRFDYQWEVIKSNMDDLTKVDTPVLEEYLEWVQEAVGKSKSRHLEDIIRIVSEAIEISEE